MFATGFQSVSFQGVFGVGTPQPSGFGGPTPYQRYRAEEYQREKIRQEKSELQKLESVLVYNQRNAEIAAESKKLADLYNQKRLQKLENEYLTEVARLLAVKAELIRRIKQSEEALILMIAMKRKRFRAVNWQVNYSLVKH